MKVYYNSEFLDKLNIDRYLLGGFYGIARATSDIVNESEDSFGSGGTSKCFYINTIFNNKSELTNYDGPEFILSINLTKVDNLGDIDTWITSKYSQFYFYYIDYFTNALLTANDLLKDIESDSKSIRKNAFAFKLVWDEVEFPYEFFYNEIIHIPLLWKDENSQRGVREVKASFKCICNEESPDIAHFNSSNYGTKTYFDSIENIMSKSSGELKIKEHIVNVDNYSLKGIMKIKPNGVIEL